MLDSGRICNLELLLQRPAAIESSKHDQDHGWEAAFPLRTDPPGGAPVCCSTWPARYTTAV